LLHQPDDLLVVGPLVFQHLYLILETLEELPQLEILTLFGIF
jgi:hypothetical protein